MATFLNNPIDISEDFRQLENEYYFPAAAREWDAQTARGKIEWQFHRYTLDWFFNKIDKHLTLQQDRGAPFQDYDLHPVCDMGISFVSERTLRIRMNTSSTPGIEHPSLMLHGDVPKDHSWQIHENEQEVVYAGKRAQLVVNKKSFSLTLTGPSGNKLVSTQSMQDLKAMHSKAMPFCFVRRASDYSRSIAASFSLYPDEKIVGGGESFTRLNKRGEKMVLVTADTQSAASEQMYKPIPFFMSSRGYGMFVHTTSPVTMDFGKTQTGSTSIFIGEDALDIFLFVGSPEEILYEYTGITGRSPLPPLWSFGLWMSRFTYKSQKEVESVAEGMRKGKFPCDVIHLDSGWFEKGLNCDFEFNKSTFPAPEKLFARLKEKGFHTSVWQIPYLTPHNPLFEEVVQKRFYIKDGNGNIPTEDAILDFSNPEAVEWYSAKLKNVLQKGADAIKVDFGEAAPMKGCFASGRTGFYEHNNYPLRYNKLVSDLTKAEKGHRLIWARSAWAGSQRYPVHWGGDAEVSDAGMAGSLRGGLSLGMSGFSFWSHDIGGFSGSPGEDLFQRWAFFGLLSSHSRVHGFPPREPWEFSEDFQRVFRNIVNLKYSLMPYVYAQAAHCSARGLPLLRALCISWPNDPVCWMVDDQYLFGNDLLVAPIMEAGTTSRMVYLPAGNWINYFTGECYEGMQWKCMESDTVPGILLVRNGALIPQATLAQSTAYINWEEIDLVVWSDGKSTARGLFFMNDMQQPELLEAALFGEAWELVRHSKKDVNFVLKDSSEWISQLNHEIINNK